MEACTAAAFDVITAFAVPSPGCQMGQSVFSGSGVQRVTPSGWSPGLLRIGHWLGSRPFRLAPSTMLPPPPGACNAAYRCNSPDGKGGFAGLGSAGRRLRRLWAVPAQVRLEKPEQMKHRIVVVEEDRTTLRASPTFRRDAKQARAGNRRHTLPSLRGTMPRKAEESNQSKPRMTRPVPEWEVQHGAPQGGAAPSLCAG